MRLSLQTDYALRTLMFLAAVGKRATIAQVSDFYGISEAHVAKVVHQLGRLGLVRNIRGVGGGIELGCDPRTTSVGEIVRHFEGTMHLLECVGRDGVCTIEGFCKLRGVLAEAEKRQMEYLDQVMLADVLPRRSQLVSLGIREVRTGGER